MGSPRRQRRQRSNHVVPTNKDCNRGNHKPTSNRRSDTSNQSRGKKRTSLSTRSASELSFDSNTHESASMCEKATQSSTSRLEPITTVRTFRQKRRERESYEDEDEEYNIEGDEALGFDQGQEEDNATLDQPGAIRVTSTHVQDQQNSTCETSLDSSITISSSYHGDGDFEVRLATCENLFSTRPTIVKARLVDDDHNDVESCHSHRERSKIVEAEVVKPPPKPRRWRLIAFIIAGILVIVGITVIVDISTGRKNGKMSPLDSMPPLVMVSNMTLSMVLYGINDLPPDSRVAWESLTESFVENQTYDELNVELSKFRTTINVVNETISRPAGLFQAQPSFIVRNETDHVFLEYVQSMRYQPLTWDAYESITPEYLATFPFATEYLRSLYMENIGRYSTMTNITNISQAIVIDG